MSIGVSEDFVQTIFVQTSATYCFRVACLMEIHVLNRGMVAIRFRVSFICGVLAG